MSRSVNIDPTTDSRIKETAEASLREIFDELVEGIPEEVLSNWQAVALMFYTNGFIHGGIEAVSNEEFREDIELMLDEIKFQREQWEKENGNG